MIGSSPAAAADVRVTKSIGSSLTVTDNVDLAPDGEEEGALITSVSPSASVIVDGNRLDLLFSGTVALRHFSNDDSFLVDQNVLGAATAELWEDWLYLDLEGSSSRQLLEPASRVSASGSGRGDRESVTVLEASPYLAHSFGNWADGELRYRRIETFAGSGDTTQEEQRLELQSGSRFTRTQGALLLEHIRDEGDSDDDGFASDDLERSTAMVSGKYAAWRQFSPTAKLGYDEIDSESSRDLSGPFYQVGFDSRPGPRTEFSIGVGQRYGGLWVEGDFAHEITPRLTLTGAINRVLESNTDRRRDRRRENVFDPVTGELVIGPGPEDLIEDSQSGVAVTWRGDVGLSGLYGRNALNLGFVYIDREFDTRSETTYGLTGLWSRQLSRTWSSRLSGFATHVDDEDSTNTFGAQASLDYLIYTNTVISFGVSHTQRHASEESDEYTENTAFVAGRLRF
ncbi:MAG: TIGR03016 family PEP-CTERM system-associated outer membrane protein [Tistlia sp.]|uniref:TIGR03016 family PEP-CTERM system-associated outer membrane protein n=1 Tax=Tistlia sp. TaxID=3057121 RepID=UPI0034A3E617